MHDSNNNIIQSLATKVGTELIEFILELTSCTEIDCLADTLTRILKYQLEIETTHLYRLEYTDASEPSTGDPLALAQVYDLVADTDTGEMLSENPVLEKAVRTRQPVLDQSRPSSSEYAYPMLSQSGVSHVLYLQCANLDETRIRQTEVLWKIWQHLHSLVERNELDGLTGLLNRVAFDNRLPDIFSNSSRSSRRKEDGQLNVLALVDIDHFKQVNDQHGHLLGDEILVQLSRLMSSNFRGNDLVFRFGGEEFLVILKNCTLENARITLDRFRQKASQYEYPRIGHKTVSIGMTGISTDELPTTILDRADKALYYSKKNGRDQCSVYEDLVAEGKLSPVSPGGDNVELF